MIASGDLRNVVKSLASLLADFFGNCNIVVNDGDLDIVSRNVLLILEKTSLLIPDRRQILQTMPIVVPGRCCLLYVRPFTEETDGESSRDFGWTVSQRH